MLDNPHTPIYLCLAAAAAFTLLLIMASRSQRWRKAQEPAALTYREALLKYKGLVNRFRAMNKEERDGPAGRALAGQIKTLFDHLRHLERRAN